MLPPNAKPVVWIASALKDLRSMPPEVRETFAYAIAMASSGPTHPDAKAMKGFRGGGVMEVVENYDRGTYRAVYTAKLSTAVYVLHAFKKKSKTGVKTPRSEIDLIEARLKAAVAHDQAARQTGKKQQ
jgi:phage-related protein